MGEKALGILGPEHGGALVRHQAVTVYQEFIALGLASEDGMIVEHQTRAIGARLPQEEQSRSQSADSATDDHTVIEFMLFLRRLRQRFELAVATAVTRGENRLRVAVSSS